MNADAVVSSFFAAGETEETETSPPPSLVITEYVPPPMPEPPPAHPQVLPSAYDTRFFDPVGGSIPAREPLMVLRASDPLAVQIVEQYAQAATGENRERAKVIARAMQQWRQANKSRNAQIE